MLYYYHKTITDQWRVIPLSRGRCMPFPPDPETIKEGTTQIICKDEDEAMWCARYFALKFDGVASNEYTTEV